MNLSSDQQNALDKIMHFISDGSGEKELVLSGHGGTGKSTLIKTVLATAHKHQKVMNMLKGTNGIVNIELTATTNKAAKVLADATGMEVKTIHSMLGLRVFNDFKTGKTVLKKSKATDIIKNTMLIIDEASMINKDLLKIIREQTNNTKILYVGDSYQLAPVKENKSPVFEEILNQVKLTTIHRQAAGNPIVQFAEGFRNALDTGVFPEVMSIGSEVQLLEPIDFQAAMDTHLTNFTDDNAVRALAWTNGRVHDLNGYIRHIQGKGTDLTVGERVLTNQPIMNSNGSTEYATDSIAEITEIWPSKEGDINGWRVQLDYQVTVFQAYVQKEVTNRMKQASKEKDWPTYFAMKDTFADLRPIYACTIAKSQGSTYKTVFIDLNDVGRCTIASDVARMMFVCLTRASERVYLTGELPRRLYV